MRDSRRIAGARAQLCPRCGRRSLAPQGVCKGLAITTKVKSKLAAQHLTSVARIHVDTDADGVVWLSGTAKSQEEIDRAVSIARGTERVVAVKNELTVQND
jgi:hyperosmotically inducible protein